MDKDLTRRGAFLAGAKDTIPLILGAIPFGLIFGIAATQVGLSVMAVLGMSLFVYAGSSQFIAAQLVGEETAIILIIFTTFIVNLRHMLYSASLAPYMKHLPQRWLLPLGFTLTDETYAVVIRRYQSADASPFKHWYHLGSAAAMYTNWQLCTLIGIVAGQSLAGAQSLGLDFAMTVTFIGIVVPLITSRPMLACALAAAVTAVMFNGLDNNLGLIIAAVCGIAAGMLVESLNPRPTLPNIPATEGHPTP